MSTRELGRLGKVDLRTVWTSEATDFTPWLAQAENLALLGETLGLDLKLDSVEKNVGPYRADILCKDTLNDTWVLVENQLEYTDHLHLGQLLTYAAGLDTVTIVWIARRFTDEHRAALDWLNDITGEAVNFFGLEVELWQIGKSAVAPKFNIVSKPNSWVKTLAESRRGGELSETKQLQLAYWTAFKEYLKDHQSPFKAGKAASQFSIRVGIPVANCHLEPYIILESGHIGVSIILSGLNAKRRFHGLAEQKEAIEGEVGSQLIWRELPKNIRSTVDLSQTGYNVRDEVQWPDQFEWMCQRLERFREAFLPRILQMDKE